MIRFLSVFSFLAFSFFQLGCAADPRPLAPASISPHTQVDAALSIARQSQQHAALQAESLVHTISDPVTKHAAEDLQATVNALGLQLETATGKLTWYESQFDVVTADRDKWQAQDARDQAARAQSEKERDALVWVFALACGMVALSTFRPALQVFQMPWQLIALAGVYVGGFALGFTVGRYSLRFLAQFTPHLPF